MKKANTFLDNNPSIKLLIQIAAIPIILYFMNRFTFGVNLGNHLEDAKSATPTLHFTQENKEALNSVGGFIADVKAQGEKLNKTETRVAVLETESTNFKKTVDEINTNVNSMNENFTKWLLQQANNQ